MNLSRITALSGGFSLLLIMLSGCTGQMGQHQHERKNALRPLEVEVAIAAKRPLAATLAFHGNLLPWQRAVVVAEVDGVIRKLPSSGSFEIQVDGKRYSEILPFLPGHLVRKGDVLVELDRTELTFAVKKAEAQEAKIQADLAKLKAGERAEEIDRLTALRDESKARYANAELELRRGGALYNDNALSVSEHEKLRMQMLTAKATLQSSEAMLRRAKAGPTREDIAVAQAELEQAKVEVQQQRTQLEKTVIRAPFDGFVTDILVQVGDRVSAANGQVLEIMDLRYLVAEIAAPEAYLGIVKKKDRAQVLLAGAKKAVPGLVVSINEKVNYETRAFQVRVAIDNRSGLFKAGQFAEVSLDLKNGHEPLTIPTRAIVFVEGQPHVFVCDNGTVTQRRIQIGLADGEYTEVLSGIAAGTRVVTDDPALLTDGMQVSLRQSSQK